MTAAADRAGSPAPVAIIGSGNIGTDLLGKVSRSPHLEPAALIGIDPASDGLARARRLGVPAYAGGVAEFLAGPDAAGVRLAFDATSAGAHRANAEALARAGITVVDLTPAATGPLVVPSVNLGDHLDAPDVNLVTCGGQATVPVVAALSSVAPVLYAEIVAAISSRSAGPGTRANIDEFTTTTAYALRTVGGARRSKAIIVLNPADPPILMRNTVHALLPAGTDRAAVEAAVGRQIETVARFVPGYRLKQPVQLAELDARTAASLLAGPADGQLLQVTVYLEVEGAADYLPAYAGNLDIMTAAAVRVAEVMARPEVAAA